MKKLVYIMLLMNIFQLQNVSRADEGTDVVDAVDLKELPALSMPQDAALGEGLQTEISKKEIEALIPWAKSTRESMRDGLKFVDDNEVQPRKQVERLMSLYQDIVKNSSPQASEMLFRYLINRSLKLIEVDTTLTGANAFGGDWARRAEFLKNMGEQSLTFLEDELKWMSGLKENTNLKQRDLAGFGIKSFALFLSYSRQIINARAQAKSLWLAMAWLRQDLFDLEKRERTQHFSRYIINITNVLNTIKCPDALNVNEGTEAGLSDEEYLADYRGLLAVALQMNEKMGETYRLIIANEEKAAQHLAAEKRSAEEAVAKRKQVQRESLAAAKEKARKLWILMTQLLQSFSEYDNRKHGHFFRQNSVDFKTVLNSVRNPDQWPADLNEAGYLEIYGKLEVVYIPAAKKFAAVNLQELAKDKILKQLAEAKAERKAAFEKAKNEMKPKKSELGMEFVMIPNGLEMQKTEVTQGQWVAVMGSNPSYFKRDDQLPVECVTGDDAQNFAVKVTQKLKDGYTYRLPTEEELEYAARAGTTKKYSFGDDESQLNEYAWYTKNAQSKTHAVATKKANAWGLHDMLGNVSEWTQTLVEGTYRVLRGGSWKHDVLDFQSAYNRNVVGPSFRYSHVGFRLVRTR